jgi:transcriptional regulator with XRE-family HTH domain
MDTDAALTARIAEIVREAIEASGTPIKSLAESAGIARGTLIRKLRGPSESPFTPAELARLAPFVGMTPGEVVTRAETSLGRAA